MSTDRLRPNSYLRAKGPVPSKSGKTSTWVISNLDGRWLGEVRWHSPWRRYAFLAWSGTILEQDCLRHLAEFVEDRTREHRKRDKP